MKYIEGTDARGVRYICRRCGEISILLRSKPPVCMCGSDEYLADGKPIIVGRRILELTRAAEIWRREFNEGMHRRGI